MENRFVEMCSGLYENVQASVLLEGQQSRWFDVDEGLRQGCPLSPLLYSIYVMGMLEELEREELGVKMDGMWCGALLYADDIVLLAEMAAELQKMLDAIGRYAERWRFDFNALKSKTMVIGNGRVRVRAGQSMPTPLKRWNLSSTWGCGLIGS